MRVRCTEECFIRGVLHQSGDEFDWPGQPEDYMIPLEPDPVPVPEPVPKEAPNRRRKKMMTNLKTMKPSKPSRKNLRRPASGAAAARRTA